MTDDEGKFSETHLTPFTVTDIRHIGISEQSDYFENLAMHNLATQAEKT